MAITIGILLSTLGACMSINSGMTIQSDISRHKYTYYSPLTDHETTVIICLIIGIILIIAGICTVIFSIVNQRSKERLMKLQDTDAKGIQKHICSNCGLMLSENAKRCPQCGNVIKQEGE